MKHSWMYGNMLNDMAVRVLSNVRNVGVLDQTVVEAVCKGWTRVQRIFGHYIKIVN